MNSLSCILPSGLREKSLIARSSFYFFSCCVYNVTLDNTENLPKSMFTLFCEDFFLSVYENMDRRDKKDVSTASILKNDPRAVAQDVSQHEKVLLLRL